MELKMYLHKKGGRLTGQHLCCACRANATGKVLSLVCLSVFITFCGYAQQIPLFSAYNFNRFLINPAFTGIDNEYRAFGYYRSQWGALPGRPVTGGATLEGSFWKDRIGGGLEI